jgi:RNA polymerase sigma-70 factor (ECF subfamily)
VSGGVETAEETLIQRASDEQVRAALEAVPDSFRQAVWLRDAEGFSYVEIAEMLRVPAGTVMSRISRGRRLLAERLREAGLDQVGKHA